MAETTEPAPVRGTPRIDRKALRADLRRLVPDSAAAAAVTLVIFVLLYARVDAGTSQTITVMPDLADADEYWLYWLCQAFGWSGLLWAWITVMLGLVRSTAPVPGNRISHVRLERWHRVTSLTTIGLMFAHAFAFFLERVRDDGEGTAWGDRFLTAFVDVFVPGGYSTGTGQVAVLIGLIALYLAIPLSLAYYVRLWTGTRVWRALHRFIIVVYVLSVWHTLLYGTNVWFDGWFRTVVWALQLPVALLLLVRLLAPLRAGERFTPRDLVGASRVRALVGLGARLAAAAALLVVLVVIATGRDGGRTPGAQTGEPLVGAGMVWVGLAVLLSVIGAVVLALRGRRTRDPER